ncbi:MAG: M23 family metallopeptidase [Bacteroidales bacterium]|nr:M23 family metallopeptidase [Bacteroidales bacterium]
MAKIKYKFDTKSLQVKEVQVSPKDKLKKILLFLFTTMMFGFLWAILIYHFIDSPKERMQKREIEQYKLQYKILNDKMNLVTKVIKDLQNRDDNIYRVIFESEPIPASVRQAGFGGADKYKKLDGYKCSKLLIETTKKLDKITSQLYVQSKSYDEVFKMAKNKERMMSCIPAIQPVDNKDLNRISSYYGWRIHPIFKRRMFHEGLDYSARKGTNVYASGDGKVIMAKRTRFGYGNKIVIDHGYGYKTAYAHLDKIKVRKGQKVKRGQVIGTVGTSGLSTGPHLHYEVIKNNKRVNPIYYIFNDLSPEEYENILDYSHRVTSGL